mmetsp:Transcript_133576/g.415383  ORF Transcript_133576/g.415383 Transcript_133576/m.415383 type:complete len:225 (+) Transcript_133576:295-969(+)
MTRCTSALPLAAQRLHMPYCRRSQSAELSFMDCNTGLRFLCCSMTSGGKPLLEPLATALSCSKTEQAMKTWIGQLNMWYFSSQWCSWVRCIPRRQRSYMASLMGLSFPYSLAVLGLKASKNLTWSSQSSLYPRSEMALMFGGARSAIKTPMGSRLSRSRRRLQMSVRSWAPEECTKNAKGDPSMQPPRAVSSMAGRMAVQASSRRSSRFASQGSESRTPWALHS